jgi:hypothetical protein
MDIVKKSSVVIPLYSFLGIGFLKKLTWPNGRLLSFPQAPSTLACPKSGQALNAQHSLLAALYRIG